MNSQDGTGASAADGDGGSLRERARAMLESHWRADGYTMPNSRTYPWQWLWDSCFHALVWSELGDERALVEVDRVFTHQTPRGFVPHMGYHPDPGAAVAVWGRPGASTITQPPMYGHALAELAARGMTPTEEMVVKAERGLRYLLSHRRRSAAGLVELCHPWESGCDDSARWDSALGRPWQRDAWRRHKLALLGGLAYDDEGGAMANDRFAVASIGFNALVAFNTHELADLTGSAALRGMADDLAQRIATRWDEGARTWIDDGAFAADSGAVRTVDAHLALLVDDAPAHVAAAVPDLVDPLAFGAPYGPAGTHRDEPTRDPITYWRGPAWPQLSYLLWVAARRRDRHGEAASIASSTRSGAVESGFAEYWHPDTGAGLGAIPQSWAALALLMDPTGPSPADADLQE